LPPGPDTAQLVLVFGGTAQLDADRSHLFDQARRTKLNVPQLI